MNTRDSNRVDRVFLYLSSLIYKIMGISKKNLIRSLSFLAAVGITFIAINVFGQEVEIPTDPSSPVATPEWFGGAVEAIFGAIVLIAGYVKHLIPGIKKINQNVYKVLAIAVVVGIAFLSLGWANVIQLLFGYTSVTSLYELALKAFIKKKPVDITEKPVDITKKPVENAA